jgi:hypothetical protein
MNWNGQMSDDDTPMLEYGCHQCNIIDVLKEIDRIIKQDGQDFTDGEIIDQISGLLQTGFWYFIENKGEQK